MASTPRRRASATAATPSAIETWTTCSEQPVSSASSSARSMAASSAAGGRDAAHSCQLPSRGARSRDGRSAWTATGRPSAAARCMPAPSASSSTAWKSSIPESHMNALKPTTPRAASSSRRSRSPGTSPPHSAKSTAAWPVAAATLASNAAPSTVGGWALSGISTQAVAPPAASAAVPVAQPSQSARPGSLKCTWASIAPGSTCSPRASTSSRAGSPISGAISAMTPSSTAMSRSSPRTIRSITRGPRRSARARRAPPRRRPPRPPRRGCG